MILTTTDSIAGKNVEVIGFVEGSATRAKHIGNDFIAGLKGIVGGEVHEYTQLLVDTREQALGRLQETAKSQGADAVIAMRITTSTISAGVSEILAYGTAVKFV
jgi:uncharacterized protein YbjQ (UPF0145 family)